MTTKQKVGILAYGSLIGRPGWEIEQVRTDTITEVLTPFPVEFARKSRRRGYAPTLVPYKRGGQVRAQVFVVETTVEDAQDRLYRREINDIGGKRRYVHSERPGRNTVIVEWLEGRFGLDIVLSTRIAATIDDPDAPTLARLAIDSVARTDAGRDGISYLMNALEMGIETPLTADYTAEILGLTGADDLAGALAKERMKVKA